MRKVQLICSVISFFLSISSFANERYPYLKELQLEKGLESVILKDQFHAEDLNANLQQGCETLVKFDLLKFIEDDLSPIVKSKPKVCTQFKKKTYEEMKEVSFPDPDMPSEDLTENFKLEFEDVTFNGELNGDDLPHEEAMVFKILKIHEGRTLSRPVKFEDQKSHNQNGNSKRYIDAYRGSLDNDPLLKEVLISRIWDKLSVMEKMKVHTKCTDLSLNNNKNFWNLKHSEKSDRDWYALAIKICQSESTENLIPYIDISILNEYAFYLHEDGEAMSRLYGLCEAWPEASFKLVKPLPPISRNKLLLNYAEFKMANNFYENGESINLFNGYENTKLTDDELEAISSYTGDAYDSINAYQSWGRVGLYFQRRREREEGSTDGERGEDQSYDEEGIERGIPALTKNLKSALGKLDHFEGVSFGAHQLNSHIFTRLRKGGHFEPGFFMSTSTNMKIAENFLEIPEGQLTDKQRTEVKGYLFVVKNKSGSPLENLSLYPGEYEVLLNPDSKYRVLDMEPYLHEGEELPNVKIVYIEEY